MLLGLYETFENKSHTAVTKDYLTTMANSASNSPVVNGWTLLAFAAEHGKMSVGDCHRRDANGEITETFKACSFTDALGNRTFVGFSSKLGELTPQEIVNQKDSLRVVELESGNYYLCKGGNSSWEEVNL